MRHHWSLAPGVLRLRDDRLAGGAPFRVVRLTPDGARGVEGLLGTDATPSAGLAPLADRLVRYGLLLEPAAAVDLDAPVADVTVVIPALSAAEPVAALLTAVPAGVPVVVVDDGSPQPLHDALVRDGLTVLRNATPRGPAAARNTGAAQVKTAWIAFVDADVSPEAGWLPRLLAAARADAEVVAVGPRIRSRASSGLGGLVEQHAGGLDLGPVAADVAPGGPVGYLPTALLLIDRAAFERAGGFDEAMAVAEDVDLVWRLRDEGLIRYVPSVVAWHEPRATLGKVLRRRQFYGSGAGPLEARHPGVVRHADVSVFSFVPWLLGILVRPWLALVGAAASVAVAPRMLPSLPARDAVRLAAYGQGVAAVSLGRFAIRPWWPATVALGIASPRRRRVLLAVVVSGLVDVVRRARRDEDVAWSAVPAVVLSHLLDDLAYSVGVFEGVVRTKQFGPLLPRVRGKDEGLMDPLREATWPDIAAAERRVLLLPTGSLEQHGPHLPLATDTLVAEGIAARVHTARPSVGLAPAIPVGASGEHDGFPGTVSIGTDALCTVVVEVVRNAAADWHTVVVVNGHGGNADALRQAGDLCRHEGRRLEVVHLALPGMDAHAGRAETSMLLHLHPDLVRPDRAEAGSTTPIADLLPALRAGGVRAVSPNGVLGDPAGAHAAEGADFVRRLIAKVLAVVDPLLPTVEA